MPNNINHVSFIMDGNNRWSKKNNISILNSYSKGAENLIKLANFIFQNTNIISAFALSSKNLKRPKKTLDMIIEVLDKFLDKSLKENNIHFHINLKVI